MLKSFKTAPATGRKTTIADKIASGCCTGDGGYDGWYCTTSTPEQYKACCIEADETFITECLDHYSPPE